ncbi:MAG: putative quinol monooxygenase [Planctomycetota bacterium]|nr:putative quinol monooxygenase [Planctomycetota bacterium]
MIYVIATIEIAADKRDQFIAAFRANVPHVLAEEGCIEYQPTVDLATEIPVQPAERANVVTVVEKWDSLAALKAHLVAPHMVSYRETVKDLVTGVSLQVLEPAIV